MDWAAHLQPWHGEVFRHIADDPTRTILDFSYAARGSANRWNVPGEPTLYLATDPGVTAAEWGRRLEDLALEAPVARRLYGLTLALDRVLDLRDPLVCAELKLSDAPHCFLDLAIARATAHFLRTTSGAQALVVPSVAFLDDLTRGNLVLFLERLLDDPLRVFAIPPPFVTRIRDAGRLTLEPANPEP